MSDFNFSKMLEKMKEDSAGGRTNFFFPKEPGTYRIRILPPLHLQNESLFYHKRKIHWLVGNSVTCINQDLMDKNGEFHESEPCYACDLSKRLFKISEDKTPEREMAYEIRAQIRYLYRVIVRGENEHTPLFYESGKTIFDLIYSVLTNPDWGNILSPAAGRDFNLIKTGSGVKSNYSQSSPIPAQTQIYGTKEEIKVLLIDEAPKLEYSSQIGFLSRSEITALVKRHTNPDNEEAETKAEAPVTIDTQEKPAISVVIPPSNTEGTPATHEITEIDGDEINNLLSGFE